MSTSFTFTGIIHLAVVFILSGIIFGAAKSAPEADAMFMGPSFSEVLQWFNTPPLALKELRARILLIFFWSYTCISRRRTLSCIREWALPVKPAGTI